MKVLICSAHPWPLQLGFQPVHSSLNRVELLSLWVPVSARRDKERRLGSVNPSLTCVHMS
ncbi:unnamed protein product [Mycena citricolor]|uniref:Uncharacterized protein n=1 Tax=Mycena citricolor TaxID=2018698 RepID=A0AAD2H339_9AGAR|nr:unnamed protein product [Mycena citricolor]